MEPVKNFTNDEMVYEYGIDVERRTIFMNASSEGDDCGIIDTSNADHVIKSLHLLVSNEKSKKKPITIVMNSPGGTMYDGNAIYDAIKNCPAHITVLVLGRAMSMASVILQAADRRILSRNATLMLHYGEMGHSGDANPQKRKNEHKEDERLAKMMARAYWDRIREKHPKFTREKLHDLMFEKYLSASQAVRLGLADHVIRTRKK
jgi:ATP-dependent Clp endopeptidase proteolytic subunit ClpP